MAFALATMSSCSPSAYLCPTGCLTRLTLFFAVRQDDLFAAFACLDFNSGMWLIIPEPIHDWGLWGVAVLLQCIIFEHGEHVDVFLVLGSGGVRYKPSSY